MLCSRKLTEHSKPAIMEKKNHFIKKNVARGQLRRPGSVHFSQRRGTSVGFCNGDSLFVPSFRALDCSNFIGNTGWSYRQLFATDYITVLKVHWLTITWYSSYTSCSKIFVLTKFSEYNLRAIRYIHHVERRRLSTNHPMASKSPQVEEVDTRIGHSQILFLDWCLSLKCYGTEIV